MRLFELNIFFNFENLMLLRKIQTLFYLTLLLLQTTIFATNELSINGSGVGSSIPGYIDNSVIVIEPHGGYFEQSLYLQYSDHGEFNSSEQLEVVHRFELPKESVVNDMWLWIGDSVMQAIMLDTWTARAIYDSIVTNKRDPAFLTKKKDQYEFHVYPLFSGEYRKVKINMITPTKWLGQDATAELPYKMLNANNASSKPVDILFRQKIGIWGTPEIVEKPEIEFVHIKDTLDYQYFLAKIDDISSLGSLNIQYSTSFENGYFYTGLEDKSDTSYFQLGLLPKDLFNLEADSTAKNVLVGIDLSGSFNKNLNKLLPEIENVLNSAISGKDSLNIIISGANQINFLKDNLSQYSEDSLKSILVEFQNSYFADSISTNFKPVVLFSDYDAYAGWGFPDIDNFALVQKFGSILQAKNSFNSADIICAYRYGFDDPITESDFNQLVTPIDSFFVNGGRFLAYFDQNRNVDKGNELIATHYINGLKSKWYSSTATTLYRNDDGNFGKYFPEEIDHNFVWTLEYDDPDVKIELMNSDGDPVIISKVIKNRGLLVVTAIWQIKDDDAMKTQFNPALLGLNSISKNLLLPKLLTAIKNESSSNNYDKCLLFSNSDSLIFTNDAVVSTDEYLSDFDSPPIFHTINLLNGEELALPSVSDNLKTYYGSGFLLQVLSDSTNGLHFERYNSEWDFIASSLSYSSLPLMENFKITSIADDGAAEVHKIIEVNPIKNDPNKPMFFIGSTSGKNKLNFSIEATYNGVVEPKSSEVEFLFNHDSTKYEKIIPSLLANERLNEMFTTEPIDTAGIVSLSIQYNLLTDYTALLALEPNDSLHFMEEPNDESELTDIKLLDEEANNDSTFIEVYPNPFNNQASISFNMAERSLVNISIYNILGQKIIDLVKSEYIEGYRNYIWSGTNSNGVTSSSGIYFVILHYKEISSNSKNMISKKILYLK